MKFLYTPRRKIKDISNLLKILRKNPKGYLNRIYLRGQSDASWGLRPSIGRPHWHGGKLIKKFSREQEKNLLHRFRRHAYLPYQRTISEWEALFLGRHHELPVRLLDWTANPSVALYCACSSDKKLFKKDGAIWILTSGAKEKDIINVFRDGCSPLDIKGVKLIPPFNISERMIVQSSIFTIQDDPWRKLETFSSRDFKTEEFDIEKIEKFIIPCQYKEKIIEDLEKLGINSRTLFPDFDGLTKGLWQTEVIRKNI